MSKKKTGSLHYLLCKEFVFYSYDQALKFLDFQKTINKMFARWYTFLQRFNFTIKHKYDKLNKVADALSRRASLLTVLSGKIVTYDALKDTYADDEDFSSIWQKCVRHEDAGDFLISEGFLFKNNMLCLPKISITEAVIQELHGGGLK